MMNRIQSMANACKTFYRKEDGSSTLEFMMVLPAAMFFFAATYESGVIGLRNVMFERAVDMTVRQVRIGAVEDPSHENLKQMICDAASIIPECMTSVKLEMIRKDIRAWTPIETGRDCVNRQDQKDSTIVPKINWSSGSNNELMVLRACAMFSPVLPTSTVGAALQSTGDEYALVATSSFVVEPYK